jgi:hypothetical protein
LGSYLILDFIHVKYESIKNMGLILSQNGGVALSLMHMLTDALELFDGIIQV